MKKKKLLTLELAALGLFFVGLLIYTRMMADRIVYQSREDILYNPYMGFAPSADNPDVVRDNTLVYVDVLWSEWETEKDFYDVEGVKRENNWDRWKREGKNVVLRFVCDVPGESKHMDIPQYLYEETKDGVFYNHSYGKGYSPNYENEYFIERHSKAITELGYALGRDDFVAYVELGSVGHWGEWHVKQGEAGTLPGGELMKEYIKPYTRAFPNAQFLMRRPFAYIEEYPAGVYNDMQGEPESTEKWLSWIKTGGEYTESKETMKYVAVPEGWKKNAIGGEFTSSLPLEEMITDGLQQTIKHMQESHTTFSGPMCPVEEDIWENYQKEIKQLYDHIGYRYKVTAGRFSLNDLTGKVYVKLDFQNLGSAPLYKDWPLCIYFLDENLNVVHKEVQSVDLKNCEKKVSIKTSFAIDSLEQEFSIAVGIENPATNLPAIELDMDTDRIGKMFILYRNAK